MDTWQAIQLLQQLAGILGGVPYTGDILAVWAVMNLWYSPTVQICGNHPVYRKNE
jgi:hypothetical protein